LERSIDTALVFGLRAANLSLVQQCGAKMYYHDVVAGGYLVDLLVEDMLLVELKIVNAPASYVGTARRGPRSGRLPRGRFSHG
jgi:hypothetical protein